MLSRMQLLTPCPVTDHTVVIPCEKQDEMFERAFNMQDGYIYGNGGKVVASTEDSQGLKKEETVPNMGRCCGQWSVRKALRNECVLPEVKTEREDWVTVEDSRK